MSWSSRCCGIAALLLALAGTVVGGTLTEKERAKLHPRFQVLLDEQPPTPAKMGEELFGAIVLTSDPEALRAAGVVINSRLSNFVTAQLTRDQIKSLAGRADVQYVDPGIQNYPTLDVSVPETGASLVHGGFVNGTPYKGQGVIVVIYDSGIDWTHPDFRDPADPSKSRILSIWDQTLTPVAGESSPADFFPSYGVEYTKAQIDDELDGSPTGFVRERDNSGHGTHVAGIAAGGGSSLFGKYTGMAPMADIIVIKGGESSFDEDWMIDGLTYAQNKGLALGKPVVVNFSLGGQSGSHDGTRPYEVAMASFVANPGRVVTVSAGNDGNVAMHVGDQLLPDGTTTIAIIVPSYSPTAGTGNDDFVFDVWIDGDKAISATLISPNGISYTRNPNELGNGPNSNDGTMSLYNTIGRWNGNRNITVWVRDAGVNVPRPGTWKLVLNNTGTDPALYDGWLNDRTIGSSSTVSLPEGDVMKTVAMPGTSTGAITVGGYGTKWSWPTYTGAQYGYVELDRVGRILSYSSVGPTRDGRLKPDIAAPAQGIFSALSSHEDTTGASSGIAPGQKHILEQGTSMAAPHVAGAAAILLGANPSLTFAQVRNRLTSTANTDGDVGFTPNFVWGSGKLDVAEALARVFNPGATVTRTVVAYDQPNTVNFIKPLTRNEKAAVGFTTPVAGKLAALVMNVTPNRVGVIGSGNAIVEVFSDNGGIPGSQIGSSVVVPLQRLTRGTMNYVQLLDAKVNVNAGQKYHLVLSLGTATDTLTIRNDSLSSPATTTSWFNGTSWSRWTSGHLRIQSIITSGTDVSAVEVAAGTPLEYSLAQNYPNPFNPTTTFGFSLPVRSAVSLKIYNVLGQEVATLVNEDLAGGKYQVQWHPENLASGSYFYRLQVGGYVETKKLMYLK